jgi:methionyl-tRNA formyltransferase
VLQPETINEALLNALRAGSYEVYVLAAYGKILPKNILDLPKRGILNIHPSLLPKFRGASPVRAAILGNVPETGVTIIRLDEKMDHGPIVAQAKINIEMADWPPPGRVLEEMLAREGGKLLAEVLQDYVAGGITPEPQDDSKATYCKKIVKEDGLLKLTDDPYQNFLKIRAFDGWPGAYFFAEKGGKQIRVKITDAEFKDGKLEILKVIPEGKREMDYAAF